MKRFTAIITALVLTIIMSFGNINEIYADSRKSANPVVAVDTCYKHCLAILEDGSLYAWGNNENGQLGNGTTTSSLTPVKIMDNVVACSAGYHHSLAVTEDGSLYAWVKIIMDS